MVISDLDSLPALYQEHNRKVLCAADWIIDLGPEGGKRGGYLIAQGTPEVIMKNANSSTGKVLSQEMI